MSFVKDIMKSKIVTIEHGETIRKACDKFNENKVGCLVVTNNQEIVGIVTERDLIERALCKDLDLNTAKIEEIMSTNVITIGMDKKIMAAVDVMRDNKIKKLPVVHNGAIIGIITSTDVAYSRPSLKHFIRE